MGLPVNRLMERSAQDHAVLERVLSKGGINGFDPATPAGRMIAEMKELFGRGANPEIPEGVRAMGVEAAVVSVILSRPLVEIMMLAEAPAEGSTKIAKAKRARYTAASSAYRQMMLNMKQACEFMGIAGFIKPSPGNGLSSIEKALNAIKEREEERHTHETTATAVDDENDDDATQPEEAS